MGHLARMLAMVDHEHEEDKRAVGCSPGPSSQYVNLREAARAAVDEAVGRAATQESQPPAEADTAGGKPEERQTSTTNTTMTFRNFRGEPTATFPSAIRAGRMPCFSRRDGHFDAPRSEVEGWPYADPNRKLLTELSDNFWPD